MLSVPQHAGSIDILVPVTTTAYTAGLCVSVPFVIPNWVNGVKRLANLNRVRLVDPQNNNVAMTLYLFNHAPTAAFVANGAFAALSLTADLKYLIEEISIPAGSSVSTGVALGSGIGAYQKVNLNPPLVVPVINTGAAQVWGVLVAAASVTYAAVGNLTLSFDISY